MSIFFRILLLALWFSPFATYANGTDARSSLWLMSFSRIQFTEKIRGFADIQPRYTVDDTKGGVDHAFDTLILRGAIGYQITPQVGVYQGYAYIPTYDPKKTEHRSFQELFVVQPLIHGSLNHRLRFEQRFLDDINDTAYRLRYMGRILYPLSAWHPNLSLAINEEIFFNLNDADLNGPQSGFDQNRFFVGFNYRVSPALAYELGYQNQFINSAGSRDNISNDILFFGIQTNFTLGR